MRRGCIIAAAIMGVVIVIAGYFGYKMIDKAVGIPEDLEAYNFADSAMARITNRTPAPPEGTHLSAADVALYIGAFDSVRAGLDPMLIILDSTMSLGKDTSFNIGKAPALVRSAVLMPVLTRRAMVNYLNDHDLSWPRYLWIKERTVAASGITQAQADSVMELLMPDGVLDSFREADSTSAFGTSAAFFRRVEEIRQSGTIDSSEIAIATPERNRILGEGAPSLFGVDAILDHDE